MHSHSGLQRSFGGVGARTGLDRLISPSGDMSGDMPSGSMSGSPIMSIPSVLSTVSIRKCLQLVGANVEKESMQ